MDALPVVAAVIPLRLLLPSGERAPVPAELHYFVADPFAIHVTFRCTNGPIRWVFARELLERGLTEAAGLGDVQLWPCVGDPDIVNLALRSPDGDAILEVGRADLASFLDRTHERVPAGSESEYLDIDLGLRHLIAEQ